MKKALKAVAAIVIILALVVVILFKSAELKKFVNSIMGNSNYENSVETDETDETDGTHEEKSDGSESVGTATTEESDVSEDDIEIQKKYEKMETIKKIDWDYHTMVFSPRYTFEKDEDGKWILSSDIDDARSVSDDDMKKIFTAFIEADIESWHGFYETNSSILDGSSFMLNVYFEEDASIFSGGTNSFPNNFNIVQEVISEVIENNIDN